MIILNKDINESLALEITSIMSISHRIMQLSEDIVSVPRELTLYSSWIRGRSGTPDSVCTCADLCTRARHETERQ